MSLVYYTITPEPELFPIAYIVRVFRETQGDVVCVQTVNFPICNPSLSNKARSQAEAFGRMTVKKLMDSYVTAIGGLQ